MDSQPSKEYWWDVTMGIALSRNGADGTWYSDTFHFKTESIIDRSTAQDLGRWEFWKVWDSVITPIPGREEVRHVWLIDYELSEDQSGPD